MKARLITPLPHLSARARRGRAARGTEGALVRLRRMVRKVQYLERALDACIEAVEARWRRGQPRSR